MVETGLQDKRVNWVYTDNIVAGGRYFAQQHAYRAPTYRFQFSQVPQNQSIQLGATHANELPYTFGVLDRVSPQFNEIFWLLMPFVKDRPHSTRQQTRRLGTLPCYANLHDQLRQAW